MGKNRVRKKKSKYIKVKVKSAFGAIVLLILFLVGGYTFVDVDNNNDNESSTTQTSPSHLNGEIVHISDGDTVVLQDSVNTKYKIRLHGIDCPETSQEYGTEATNMTKKLCSEKRVHVEVTGVDKYKRILGIIWVEGVNLNEELLKKGLAWQYKYNKSKHYKMLEEEAQNKKLNIWSMSNPTSPWDFRAKKKTK